MIPKEASACFAFIYFFSLVTAAREFNAAQTHQVQFAVLMELNSCMRGKETLWKERMLHHGMHGKLHWPQIIEENGNIFKPW